MKPIEREEEVAMTKKLDGKKSRATRVAIAIGAGLAISLAPGPYVVKAASTWNITTSGNWSVAGDWSPSGAPASANTTQLIFGGSTAYTATDDIGTGTFTLNSITVGDTAAVSVAPNAAGNTLTFAGTSPAITVNANSGLATISNGIVYSADTSVTNNASNLLTLSGATTYNSGVTATYGGSATGTGNITANAKQTFTTGGGTLNYNGSGTLTLGTTTGASFAFSSGTVNLTDSGSGTLTIADGGTFSGTGTINLSNSGSGAFNIGNVGGLSGTINVNAGTVRFAGNTGGDLFGASLTLNVASGATFDFANNAESMGAISGSGTITGASITMQLTGNKTWGGNYTGTGTFSTGATGINYTFTGANTTTGGLTIVAGSSLSIGNGGMTGSWSGATMSDAGTLIFNRSDSYIYSGVISGAGVINITGPGTINLSGTSTYTGLTTVSAGTLQVAANITTRDYTVGGSAGMTFANSAIATPFTIGNFTVGAASATSSLGFQFNGGLPTSAQSLVAVGSTLTTAGTINVSASGANILFPGQYPLIKYASLTGSGFAAFNTAATLAPYRLVGTIINNTGNSSIDLQVAPGMRWDGAQAGALWNTTDQNWKLISDSSLTTYFETAPNQIDSPLFDDNATTFTVNIPATVSPYMAVINNSAQNYTFQGAGKISGAAALVKSGTGTAVILTNNDYTGGTTVSAGTLQIGNGTVSGALPGNVALSGTGTVAFDLPGSATVAGTVSGAGTLTMMGSNTLTLTGTNTYTGTLNLNSGTVSVAAPANLGSTAAASALIVNFNGGTLQITGAYTTGSLVQIFNFGASGGTVQVSPGILAAKTGDNFTGSGTLNITGGGALAAQSSGGTGFTGAINVINGALRFTSERLSKEGNITVSGGGSVWLFDTSSFTTTTQFTIASGKTLTLSGDGDASTLAFVPTGGAFLHTLDEAGSANAGINIPIILVGSARFTETAGTSGTRTVNDTVTDTFNQAISGNGTLVKDGEGTMIVNAASTYSGGTIISNGTLKIGNTDYLPTGTTLQFGEANSVNSGKFDLNGADQTVGGLTTANGATGHTILNSSATTASTLTVAYNGTTPQTFAGVIGGGSFGMPANANIAFVKDGTGTLSLTGANTYAGSTTVLNGILRVTNNTIARPYTVNDGAGLIVGNPAPATPFAMSTLTVGTTDTTTLGFELGSSVPTAGVIAVSGPDGVTLNGTVNVVVTSSQPLPVGQFPLITYVGSLQGAGFSAFNPNVTLPPRTLGNLVDNSANPNPSVDLNITGVDFIKWTGAQSADWDIENTQNWKLNSDSSPTTYLEDTPPGDTVVFDETATNTGTVNLTTTLSPSAVTVSGPANYTFSGSGNIAGGTGLTKSGGGTLLVLTNNTNTGTTAINGGTVQVGNGGTAGSLGTGPIVDNGTLIFNRSDSVSLNASLTGTGSLTQNGSGSLAVNTAYAISGDTTINTGSVALNVASTYSGNFIFLNNGALTISGGGTFNGNMTGTGSITKSGSNTATFTATASPSGGITISGGTLQIGSGSTTGAIAGPTVNNGALIFNRSDTPSMTTDISGSGSVTVNGGGTITLTGNFTWGGATTLTAPTNLTLNPAGTNSLGGNITVPATSTLTIDTTNATDASSETNPAYPTDTNRFIFTKVLSGAGSLVKNGTGTLKLTAASDSFTGTVTINNGKVMLADPGAGSGGSSGNLDPTLITINNGGTFQFGQGGVTNENPDFPNSTYLTVNTGGTILWVIGESLGGVNLHGGSLIFNGGAVGASGTVPQDWTSGTFTTGAVATATTLSDGGTGAVVNKSTSGTVTISGAAIVGVAMNINEGTIAMVNAGNLGTAAINLGTATTAGTLDYQGATASRSGTFTYNGNGTIRISNSAEALTLSGVQAGTGTLIKDGPGKLILTGNANTLSGAVNVNAGTLLINSTTTGTGTAPTTVNWGGVLGGTGTMGAALTVAAGGTITAGSGATLTDTTGHLTTAAQVWDPTPTAAGTYAWKLNANNSSKSFPAGSSTIDGTAGVTLDPGTGAGANWDVLTMNTLNIVTTGGAFNIQIVPLAGAGANPFDTTKIYSWPIADVTGGAGAISVNGTPLTGTMADIATLQAALNLMPGGGALGGAPDSSFSIGLTGDSGGGEDIVINYSGAPEPTSLALLGVGAAGVFLRRRRTAS
jgi:autotransporter-associated beta strand protein